MNDATKHSGPVDVLSVLGRELLHARDYRMANDKEFPRSERVAIGCEAAHALAVVEQLLIVAECQEALDMPGGEAVLERHGWDSLAQLDLPATEFVRRMRRSAIAHSGGVL